MCLRMSRDVAGPGRILPSGRTTFGSNHKVRQLIEIGALRPSKSLTEAAVKKYRGFISVLVLLAMGSLGCAQTARKKGAEPSLAPVLQLLWQYDTGG